MLKILETLSKIIHKRTIIFYYCVSYHEISKWLLMKYFR